MVNLGLDLKNEQARCKLRTMTTKEIVPDLHRIPADASRQDIAYELEFIAAIRQGVAELDNGQSISVGEIEHDLSSWLTESDSHIPPERT